MKKIDEFTNLYSVSKTLRFKALPIGKTRENIALKNFIETDEERNKQYEIAKKIIDRYHKEFIDRILSSITEINGLARYIALFLKRERTEEENDEMRDLETSMRVEIANAFKKDEEFKSIFSGEIIKNILPQWLSDEEEIKCIKGFSQFSTAFTGFFENRANLYSEEAKSTAISYRVINDNLPRYISNCMNYERVRAALGDETIKQVAESVLDDSIDVVMFFSGEAYPFFMSSKGIETYNAFLGGYTNENGEKIKGLNECINLYNQALSKSQKSMRLPILKPLYKQLLSDREGFSYAIYSVESDYELIEKIESTICKNEKLILTIDKIRFLLSHLSEYQLEGIFVKNGVAVTSISNALCGKWNAVSDFWYRQYDAVKMKKQPKDMETYEDVRRKAFNKIGSFSLSEITRMISDCDMKLNAYEYFANEIEELCGTFDDALKVFENEFVNSMDNELKLAHNSSKVEVIKGLLDSIKAIEVFIKPLYGTGTEEDRDDVFYGEFVALSDMIAEIDTIYNAARNYLTKKPFSTEKFKLYFDNPQIMGGWDINKEIDYSSALLMKDGLYYLAIFNPENRKVLKEIPNGQTDEETYSRMIYKQIPSASKYLSKKQINPQNPPAAIKDILAKKDRGEALSKEDVKTFIDYLCNDFLVNYPKLLDENGNNYFNFHFREPDEYSSLKEFFDDVDRQAYSVTFKSISAKAVDECVENGELYMFQLYSKDFSEHSKGTPNLHTLYFKELFSESNFLNPTIGLCGGAEFFYRPASILQRDTIVHPARQELKNKNKQNPKSVSVFEYDLIKDRRYTSEHFEVHIPIKLNRSAVDRFKNLEMNSKVRQVLRTDENPYVIGIDRGERNLLYVCVIDGKGNIVEQFSLNEIVNSYSGVEHRVNYHDLLDEKEKGRIKARQEWKTIENIKELKDGYISQVIYKICELVIKYDAVIAMEDLNSGFKNSRVKVEKQVYQKFEKALIDKFNYMGSKSIEIGNMGSISLGYQLATKFESFRNMRTQNGFIFYIPAWLTSKIDPVTGFADLLKPKYTSIEDSRKLIMSFDSIKFSLDENYFVFETDMTKFQRTDADYRKKWNICTFGDRIRTFRNPEKNNEFDNVEVNLTEKFIELFEKNGINWKSGDLREQLVKIDSKEFFVEFISLLKLTLQMRNSVTGRTDIDYLISPVMNKDGIFFDSRNCNDYLPKDADANGAYNIARKVLWAIERFKGVSEDETKSISIAIKNAEWLEYAQTRENSGK